MTIELGECVLHRNPQDGQSIIGIEGMVLQSSGPHLHAVNVGFHDSQMRGRAALIQTGWNGEKEPPYFSEDLVFRLIRSGARVVGADFDIAEPALSTLLAANIVVVDRVQNLPALPRVGFRLNAIPSSDSRVRVFAETMTIDH